MLQILKMSVAVLGFAAVAVGASAPAEAACQLIKATHSAGSKAEAAKSSQALVLQSAANAEARQEVELRHPLCAQSEGRSVLEGRPSRRPAAEAVLKPDIVTSRFYTTCFTGVVVPFVCTTGSSVCGQ